MTTVEHLTELRYRILVSIGALLTGSVIGWFLVPRVLSMLVALTGQGKLIFVTPTEAFFSFLKIAFTIGVFLSSPVVFWQAWKFVLPALFPHEREAVMRYAPAALILFVTGLLFSYFAILPIALRFLIGFATADLAPALAIGRFLSFFLGVTIPFGLVFQIPMVMLLLLHLGIVSLDFLRRIRRFVWFGSFVVGAMLTPPDVASQVLMAIPIVILYEAAIAIYTRSERVRAQAQANDEAYSEG